MESQLSWSGWLKVAGASCSTGAIPSHFHFIYLLLLFPPSIHPSIPPSFPLPVDQHSLHAELHCAQSTVAEQMASLCFLSVSLRVLFAKITQCTSCMSKPFDIKYTNRFMFISLIMFHSFVRFLSLEF